MLLFMYKFTTLVVVKIFEMKICIVLEIKALSIDTVKCATSR